MKGNGAADRNDRNHRQWVAMPVNSLANNEPYDSYNPSDEEMESLNSLFSKFTGGDEPPDYQRGTKGRRRKAAVALTVIWGGTVALHWVSWGALLVWVLTTLIGVHVVRLFWVRPLGGRSGAMSDGWERDGWETDGWQTDGSNPWDDLKADGWDGAEDWPFVSLVVAAKNEEGVIARLVEGLCSLHYPASRYEVWVVDDNSTDQTPVLLQQLTQQYGQLKVLHRAPGSTGGKSGALNEVLEKTQGDIIAVFDADAQVAPDMLQRVVPEFAQERVGAVQLRKAIANGETNFWTRGQSVEMILDAYIQDQRIALGGIGELRGNGQFVRRTALRRCGGWNEETITDDLDLTIRLHLDNWDIHTLNVPAVGEEGVTQVMALWHQRNRWAEGGYQRYLDYWRLLLGRRLSVRKKIDLLVFWFIQYILPTASVPDLVMAIARHRPPVWVPMSSLSVVISLWGMFLGLRRIRIQRRSLAGGTEQDNWSWQRFYGWATLQTLLGELYMVHWIVVMASVTARMAVRPKRLKWVKTVHEGQDRVSVGSVQL